MSIPFEACVDNFHAATRAMRCGVDRIELCAALCDGGLTPSLGLVRLVVTYRDKHHPNCRVHVLIRPRGGDFTYSEQEMQVMLLDIKDCVECGVDGIVGGALTTEGRLALTQTLRLVAAMRTATARGEAPCQFTFHRAVDYLPCIPCAVLQLGWIGVRRVLTSGGRAAALEGAATLRAALYETATYSPFTLAQSTSGRQSTGSGGTRVYSLTTVGGEERGECDRRATKRENESDSSNNTSGLGSPNATVGDAIEAIRSVRCSQCQQQLTGSTTEDKRGSKSAHVSGSTAKQPTIPAHTHEAKTNSMGRLALKYAPVTILIGGGVNAKSVKGLLRSCKGYAFELHGSCKRRTTGTVDAKENTTQELGGQNKSSAPASQSSRMSLTGVGSSGGGMEHLTFDGAEFAAISQALQVAKKT